MVASLDRRASRFHGRYSKPTRHPKKRRWTTASNRVEPSVIQPRAARPSPTRRPLDIIRHQKPLDEYERARHPVQAYHAAGEVIDAHSEADISMEKARLAAMKDKYVQALYRLVGGGGGMLGSQEAEAKGEQAPYLEFVEHVQASIKKTI